MKIHTPITSAIRNAIAIDLTPAIPAKSVPANICPASGLLYFKILKNEAGSIGNCFCSSFSLGFGKRKSLLNTWTLLFPKMSTVSRSVLKVFKNVLGKHTKILLFTSPYNEMCHFTLFVILYN